ncbi:MAG: AarF/UbiB family protein, partial [Gammaproteobacteria bacterium]|nr:AarF/UbiB family protein [Gammaproteobacteria bacterium]
KIRRPGIEHKIEADLRLLRRIAEIAENSTPELKRFRPTEIVRQFALSLQRELDLEGECRHAERISNNLKGISNIVIPEVYWEWSTTRLNVQSFIDGIRGSDLKAIEQAGLDKKIIANIGAQAVMHMVLIDGFFHADPHPGNLICLPDNQLGLIDFGMVGRLSDIRRDELVQLLFALIKKDSLGIIDILLDWMPDKQIDENALSLEIDAFLDHYHGRSLEQLHFAQLLRDLTSILREHELTLPPDLAILFKTLISLDGVGRKFDPEFNIVEIASPLLTRLMKQKYLPTELFKRGLKETNDFVTLVNTLPYDIKKLIKTVKRNGFQVNVEVKRLENFGHQMDRAASRITIGLVVAAIIIGTAIVSSIENQPTVMGLPAWGFWGFMAATFWGVFLLFSIWRGNKDN